MATLEPVGPEFYESAPWKIDTIRELDASAGAVWGAISDNSSWPKWFPGATECRTTSAQPSGVGSTRHLKGKGLDVDEVFIVWEPERVWGFTIVRMKFAFASRMAERVTITELGPERCRVEYRMAIEPKPWARWMRPLIAKGGDRTIGTGLENIPGYLKG